MKVLVVHNRYRQAGGEDVVVRNEVDMLRAHGHKVFEYCASNDEIAGLAGNIRTALGTVFSLRAFFDLKQQISENDPDVVHVHNFFPLISPSVFYACSWARVPTVLTLHNYRIVCPTALLMHDGAVTERSLHQGGWWAIRKRVYRGSLLGTIVLVGMIEVHRFLGTWRLRVTRFIALTEFAKDKFCKAGFDPKKICIKPNFVSLPAPVASQPREGFLFVGRLSAEKGISVLASAMKLVRNRNCELDVAGTGPESRALEDVPGVRMLGGLSAEAVYQRMASSRALVMPSLWYEGFPMVLVEAFANGLPIIGSRLGAVAELVEDGVTGLLFEPGSAHDLAAKLRWALDHPAEMAMMGRAARDRYERCYTAQANYEKLMGVYREAVDVAGAKEKWRV